MNILCHKLDNIERLQTFRNLPYRSSCEDATRKRGLLLYSSGEEVSDIFETLPDQREEKDYAKAVTALNGCFQPKVKKPLTC